MDSNHRSRRQQIYSLLYFCNIGVIIVTVVTMWYNLIRKGIVIMARPYKKGLDFFYHDTFQRPELQLCEARHGLRAYALYYKILEKIFVSEGYYCYFGVDEIEMLYRTCFDGALSTYTTIFTDLCNKCFCEELYRKYSIITSADIQRIFIAATSRRKRIEMIDEFILLNVDELPASVIRTSLNDTLPGSYQSLHSQLQVSAQCKFNTQKTSKKGAVYSDTYDHKALESMLWDKLNKDGRNT